MTRQKNKIVFLDAATVDLGDLKMDPISRRGSFQAVSHCPGGRIPLRLRDAHIVISNKVKLGAMEMDSFSRLKLICVAATGVNNIDLQAAQKRGIRVCNVAGYSTQTVVEHTLLFLLALSHRLVEHHEAVLRGKWSRSPFFALLDFSYRDLTGKKLGILGYGTIGRQVAKVARLLGMEVLPAKLPGRKYSAAMKRYPLKTVLAKSDFVSLHCALSGDTQGLLNRSRLKQMKPSAYLLNLARGPVVSEPDVVWALEKKIIAGYAADVTEQEPLPKTHAFLKKSLAGKVLLTPHVAWASQESRQRLINEIGKNILAFQKGRKRNQIV